MDDCANAQSEYPPITGELRGAFTASGGIMKLDGGTVEEYMTIAKSRLDALCDAIDSVHARLEEENAKLKAEHHDFAPESHYMLLPKDADGVPIHVGDVMEWWAESDEERSPVYEVRAVGIDCFFAWDKDSSRFAQKVARAFRHAKPDSWERIIEDAMFQSVERDVLVARCKALAGDAS